MNEGYLKQLQHTSKKKFVFFLVAISLLLLIDYALKVREYNNLIRANSDYEVTNSDFAKNTDNPYDGCTRREYVNESIKEACYAYIYESTESAGKFFVQRSNLDRFYVAPWHTEMKYAYQDLSSLITDGYEEAVGARIVFDQSGNGNNLQIDYRTTRREILLLFDQSLPKAKPFPGLFLTERIEK